MKVFLGSAPPSRGALLVGDTSEWPFRRHVTPPLSATPAAIHITNLHLAFPSGQVAGTRLVLTQSTYQLERWLQWEAAHPDVAITADASEFVLRQHAGEVFARRGPWSRIELVDGHSDRAPLGSERSALHDAFVQPDPAYRRAACARAVDVDPANPALLLALASAHMELQDVQDALDAVDRAVAIAPDWEATHFELGKVWLRADDTVRAADAFAEAARLMPTFATAWSNLGAALGELERPEDALVALRRALEHDPNGHPTLNNLGVVLRELGHLDDAAAAFRKVVAVAPGFIFGRYNLAQTLLLAQDYVAARLEYEQAFAQDPQKSARQECRLAVARAATGDGNGALAAIEDAIERLAGEPLAQALEEAERLLSAIPNGQNESEEPVRDALRVVRATLRS